MKQFKPKPCKICEQTFTPLAPAALYCPSCKPIAQEAEKEATRKASYALWVRKAIEAGREHTVGVGQGGSNLKGADHKQYVSGTGFFAKMRKQLKKERRFCEECSKDLENVSNFGWCLHHIDHDRTNNVLENYKLLCKRCHQLEHKCWLAFSK